MAREKNEDLTKACAYVGMKGRATGVQEQKEFPEAQGDRSQCFRIA